MRRERGRERESMVGGVGVDEQRVAVSSTRPRGSRTESMSMKTKNK